MPTLTVSSGVLAGQSYDNLLDWMDAVESSQEKCLHLPKVISGTCGNGLRKKKWERNVCSICSKVLSDNIMTPTPDIEEEKRKV